mgnify:CR=1 FL=1
MMLPLAYAGLIVMVGVVGCFAILVQQGSFGTMGQWLARRVREMLFTAFLRQEVRPGRGL